MESSAEPVAAATAVDADGPAASASPTNGVTPASVDAAGADVVMNTVDAAPADAAALSDGGIAEDQPTASYAPTAAPEPAEAMDGAGVRDGDDGAAVGAAAPAPATAAPSVSSSQGSRSAGGARPRASVLAPQGVEAPLYSSAIAVAAATSSGTPPQSRLSASAPRHSHSGRQVIADACSRTDLFRLGADGDVANAAYTVGIVSTNGQYKTIPEEYVEYRARNKVSPTFHGPVYTVEDVCVPCHACGGPVDPVRRVPVGSLFFHEGCVHCYLCGRRTGVAGLYVQVDRQAVCSECACRGYDRWVPRQEALSRGMVYGAIRGDVYAAVDAHDRAAVQQQQRHGGGGGSQQRRIAGPPHVNGLGGSTLNKASVPGALPPSLAIANVHNRRNTGARSFALMERQQYYTQSDNNMLMALPSSTEAAAAARRSTRTRRHGSPATPQYHITDGRST
ncbi:LIM domain containing protein [Novymonas esmeraldas]|uniref:LIM domain containing protein n=1 Tax=Novymonas esmeraldas TaxID=1808958 RepID=A0AAW0EQN5_9TRYP